MVFLGGGGRSDGSDLRQINLEHMVSSPGSRCQNMRLKGRRGREGEG